MFIANISSTATINAVRMTEDESHILIGKTNGDVEDVMGGSTITLSEATRIINTLSTSSDGSVLVTGADDNYVRVYKSTGGHFVYDHRLLTIADVEHVHVTNDKSKIFVGIETTQFLILDENNGTYSMTSEINLITLLEVEEMAVS